MKDKILKLVNDWYGNGDDEVLAISDRIDQLNSKLFNDYEPSIGPKPSFEQRLEKWLDNVDTDDQKKILFKLIPNLFYVGKKEFDALYRTAYNANTIKWLIDINNISLDEHLSDNLQKSIAETWFCPVTDSMRINQFYHLNGINNEDKRPDWRSLDHFGSQERLQDYIRQKGFKQIVLLEDFVGSGNQIKPHVEFAASSFKDIQFLVVPIIMCPQAREVIDELVGKFKNLDIEPVLELSVKIFLNKEREKNNDFNKLVYDLAESNQKKMKGAIFSFLGFKKIGGLIVLHTNTPNNSLPIIWSDSNWNPLFNRHVR